ncbi:P-loop containing nucleoside triphosphate hydrolase protein [Dendrothele bispora CBS 962.96]|uniref:DNA 3'-5' helicase n=1 Tax=Dendrothele bispora (strain CBS 962.96) TaxID=1314807 RepID=A0A4S8MYI3_DENBC|nr:P-loop containing nucleoside triphosphate hydrolase protein [Dendrothele bispora CBS 962.96]
MPKRRKHSAKPPNAGSQFRRQPLKPDDFKDLPAKLEKLAGYPLRQFQLDAVKAQLVMKDAVVHARTGSGKTAIAAGPHAHEKAKGMITIMVSPLIGLQNEQAETFGKEFGLKAIAVNSSNGGCKPDALKSLVTGDYQILIISPEMLQSKRFIDSVLRKPEFTRRVLSMVIDEAHVVSHWGAGFRKKYGELGMVRAFLPKNTSVVALSATLTARVRRDIKKKLQIHNDNCISIDIGNDRGNVSLVVRPIHNPLNTFADLDFVVPQNVTKADEIPKTFIYYDDVMGGIDMEDHLIDSLPSSLRSAGIVRLYSAAFSTGYKEAVMTQFKAGEVRVLICTDAAGMGCNIPDIDVVVQWKLPSSLSAFVQRAGRAARNPRRQGLAVLLVEKTAYSVNLEDELEKIVTKKRSKKDQSKPMSTQERTAKRNQSKIYAERCGILRGTHDETGDGNFDRREPKLDMDTENEGLHCLVQTGICRRLVLSKVFGNDYDLLKNELTVPCCDLCDASLLNRTRPALPKKSSTRRKTSKKSEEPFQPVQTALQKWRVKTYQKDFKGSVFGPSAILPDDLIHELASVGPFSTMSRLENVLGGRWFWFSQYGKDLWGELCKITIPELPVKSASKRTRQEQDGDGEKTEGTRKTKKARHGSEKETSTVMPLTTRTVKEASTSYSRIPEDTSPIENLIPTIQNTPQSQARNTAQLVYMNGPYGFGLYSVPTHYTVPTPFPSTPHPPQPHPTLPLTPYSQGNYPTTPNPFISGPYSNQYYPT